MAPISFHHDRAIIDEAVKLTIWYLWLLLFNALCLDFRRMPGATRCRRERPPRLWVTHFCSISPSDTDISPPGTF
ncbi:hypothetical protein BR93DRAFT_187692 [Coniochaeta sp. PMI_546]|nr:hypothetical protein BR93DRAFT_187692 [Coniochaeta sp. PMI_546]